ncbi:MAG: hypothetical protein E7631_02810 [Ruminococcaceae bacterium]|nr:hypothetical protein [Oscillospiraceae bacterium]
MMKRKISTIMAMLMLLSMTACGRTPEVDTADDTSSQTETAAGMPQQNNGQDGQTGDQNNVNPDNGADNNTADQPTIDPEPVDSVKSAEDAVRFISNNLYSLCSEVLPMAVETRALDMSDADAVQYNTGLADTAGITDIVLSESAVGSFAYSLVYVRTDGTNTDAVHQSLKDSIDPRKWVCVEAEAVNSIRLDDDICVVMGSAEQVDTISASLRQAAEGVFEQVGEPMAVL